ncbi:hypothetical protein G7Y89_g15222 [Cudoniella acicularis]|uniref:Uncharacterized protein n=1 Tax=Cudoniella acicularis TaxID=354080 RepID=A0A8H4VQ25_9HELO|nr:hypothetical protein G7Y89_g15222 [Cudoniella acicularis]
MDLLQDPERQAPTPSEAGEFVREYDKFIKLPTSPDADDSSDALDKIIKILSKWHNIHHIKYGVSLDEAALAGRRAGAAVFLNGLSLGYGFILVSLVETLNMLGQDCWLQAKECEQDADEKEDYDQYGVISWYYAMKLDNNFYRGMQEELVNHINALRKMQTAKPGKKLLQRTVAEVSSRARVDKKDESESQEQESTKKCNEVGADMDEVTAQLLGEAATSPIEIEKPRIQGPTIATGVVTARLGLQFASRESFFGRRVRCEDPSSTSFNFHFFSIGNTDIFSPSHLFTLLFVHLLLRLHPHIYSLHAISRLEDPNQAAMPPQTRTTSIEKDFRLSPEALANQVRHFDRLGKFQELKRLARDNEIECQIWDAELKKEMVPARADFEAWINEFPSQFARFYGQCFEHGFEGSRIWNLGQWNSSARPGKAARDGGYIEQAIYVSERSTASSGK